MDAALPDFKSLIAHVAQGHALTLAASRQAFDIMMSGNATPAQMGGLLMALRVRGETVEELTGAVMTMREKMLRVAAPPDAFDIVGTGGDGAGTLNISTAAAIVAAAAGLRIAKHGNRAVSSKTGSADVLAALGVNVDCDPHLVREAAWQVGLCFMMAPRHHGAMRNVGPTRVELGTRTLFNLLGPLSNPAGVKRQLIGVFARHWLRPMAETLGKLGSERVWLVHGADGTDELTITGPSHVVELDRGSIREFSLSPADAGLEAAPPEALKGAAPAENAAALTALLAGARGAFRDVVLLNVAAALRIAERADDLRQGVAVAAEAIDSGRARAKLAALVAITNRAGAGP